MASYQLKNDERFRDLLGSFRRSINQPTQNICISLRADARFWLLLESFAESRPFINPKLPRSLQFAAHQLSLRTSPTLTNQYSSTKMGTHLRTGPTLTNQYSSTKMGTHANMDTLLRGSTKITSLPVEILQMIIGFLPEDNDVANISYTCKILASSVTDAVSRIRCVAQFDHLILDPSSPLSVSEQYKNAYATRKKLGKCRILFNDRRQGLPLAKMQQALDTMKQIIIEARGEQEMSNDFSGTELRSKNLEFLLWKCLHYKANFRLRIDLLAKLFHLEIEVTPVRHCENSAQAKQELNRYETERALAPLVIMKATMIQLLLSHFLVHPELCTTLASGESFRESQWTVFQHHRRDPLFFDDALLALTHTRIPERLSEEQETNSQGSPGSSMHYVRFLKKGVSRSSSSSSAHMSSIVSSYESELEATSALGKDLGVNTTFLLHVVNLFRYHIKGPYGTLYHVFSKVHTPSQDQRMRPEHFPRKAWDGCIIEEECVTKPLKSHWIGSYTYLEPLTLAKLRRVSSASGHRESILDLVHSSEDFNYDGFQSIEFNFDSSTFTAEESLDFDFSIYFSYPIEPRSPFPHPFPHSPASLPKVLPFRGRIRGQGVWYIAGHVHCLPHQSENSGQVGGFQRINFIKYHTDEFGSVLDVYAYEGCVLPGGQMILGKWWSPIWGNHEDFSGPFIMWVGEEKLWAKEATEDDN